MHKSQILFYLLIAFVASIFVGSFWFVSSQNLLIMCLVGTMVLTISAYHKTFGQSLKGTKRRIFGFVIGCAVLIFAFGVFRINQANSEHDKIMEFTDNIIGGKGVDYILRGYVNGEPENSGSKTKFTFRAKIIVVPPQEVFVDDDILITTNLTDVKFGDRLIINASLMTPKNFQDFDYVSYLKKDGIRIISNYPKNMKKDNNNSILTITDKIKIYVYKPIFAIKNKFESAVNKSIPEPNASFINGILLGTRQNISADLKDAFSRTGTSHILAISGYNITIIAWAILSLLLFFAKRKKAFWFCVIIIIVFTVMTGASASVVRASVMGLVLLFANGYGRLYDPRNSLLLAGGAMVFINPFLLRFDIGFQLSFLAVLGLAYFYPLLSYWARKIPEIFKIKETLLATVSAQIFVAPLLAYQFHSFSLISVLANILILPFIPAAMALGFLSGVGGMILAPLGQILGYVVWAITKFQIGVVENLAAFQHASVTWNLSLPIMAIIYLALFIGLWKIKKVCEIDL